MLDDEITLGEVVRERQALQKLCCCLMSRRLVLDRIMAGWAVQIASLLHGVATIGYGTVH